MATNLPSPSKATESSVADLAEQWVTARLARGEISAATGKGHRSHLRRLVECAGGRGLDAVTVDDYVRATAHSPHPPAGSDTAPPPPSSPGLTASGRGVP